MHVYLGPCIYLGSSLQQQPHHVAVSTFGRHVQWCDVILQRQKNLSLQFLRGVALYLSQNMLTSPPRVFSPTLALKSTAAPLFSSRVATLILP